MGKSEHLVDDKQCDEVHAYGESPEFVIEETYGEYDINNPPKDKV